MKVRRYAWWALGAAGGMVIAVAVFLFLTQSYPVAVVDWHWMPMHVFAVESAAATQYYTRALATYTGNESNAPHADTLLNEVRRASLDKLIENEFIHEELSRRIPADALPAMIDERVNAAAGSGALGKEVASLYGLSFEEFKRYELEPRAEREILEGRFILEGGDFNAWLVSRRARARVSILLPGFAWDGKEVILKK